MKGLTSLRGMGRSELERLITTIDAQRTILEEGGPIAQSLAGMGVANLFFEPSTRTRLSFDLAAQRLGAHVVTFLPETSSTSKGESLRDTALTVGAIGADILVVRHHDEGMPASIGEWTGLPVINAGDGSNEHPTQALLDAVTLHRHYGRLDGLRMAIVGDVTHSRVAGSLVHAMPTMGVDLTLVGPEEWLPTESTVAVSHHIDDVLPELDVVYLLRVQTERGGVISGEYVTDFGLDRSRSARMRPDAVIMHPGPINRGVEISDDLAESPRSLILEQVRNGVPTRMVVLTDVAGGRP